MPVPIWSMVVAIIIASLWHEAGHLLAALSLKIPVRRLSIGFGPTLLRRDVGESTELRLRAIPAGLSVGVPARRATDGTIRRPVFHDIIMAAAGPLASMLLTFGALLATALLRPGAVANELLFATGAISAILCLLNLLPLPGLDGGHLLLLTFAARGHQLAPAQEIRLHRAGIQWTIGCCLVLAVVRMAGFG